MIQSDVAEKLLQTAARLAHNAYDGEDNGGLIVASST